MKMPAEGKKTSAGLLHVTNIAVNVILDDKKPPAAGEKTSPRLNRHKIDEEQRKSRKSCTV